MEAIPSDGEMKPREAVSHIGQMVQEMVHFLLLHMHMIPPTGQVYNHSQLNLKMWCIEFVYQLWILQMTVNNKMCMTK